MRTVTRRNASAIDGNFDHGGTSRTSHGMKQRVDRQNHGPFSIQRGVDPWERTLGSLLGHQSHLNDTPTHEGTDQQ